MRFKILIADNAQGSRDAYRPALLEAGYDVYEATTPEEAKSILEEHLIHLALVDLRLIDDGNELDKSGLELCREIDNFVLKVLITAFPNDWKLVRSVLQAGSDGQTEALADGFYSKADDPIEKLTELVSLLLNREFEIPCQQRIAVLTSGGDAPGMNAAVSAIVRFAMNQNVEVIGIEEGYQGVIENRMYKLRWAYASKVLSEGGTFLRTARCDDFRKQEVRRKTIDIFRSRHISGLIVIGGDGSLNGANSLAQDFAELGFDLSAVGIPGTIDNDLYGTDMSLGASSAADAMVQSMRNMIGPAEALRRIFVVEVMGACAGYLALEAAVGIGAEGLIIPENIVVVSEEHQHQPNKSWKEFVDYDATKQNLLIQIDEISQKLEETFKSNKNFAFVVVSEGVDKSTEKLREKRKDLSALNSKFVTKELEKKIADWSVAKKPTIRSQELGYPPRGVSPNNFDIWLGSTLGKAAVESLLDKDTEKNVMAGWSRRDGVIKTPFKEVVEKTNRPPIVNWNEHLIWHQLLELHDSLINNLPQPPKGESNWDWFTR